MPAASFLPSPIQHASWCVSDKTDDVGLLGRRKPVGDHCGEFGSDLDELVQTELNDWAIQGGTSGGSLFTGCNIFREEGRNPKISQALVSRLLSWRADRQIVSPHSLGYIVETETT